jgi:hypothetical protein
MVEPTGPKFGNANNNRRPDLAEIRTYHSMPRRRPPYGELVRGAKKGQPIPVFRIRERLQARGLRPVDYKHLTYAQLQQLGILEGE